MECKRAHAYMEWGLNNMIESQSRPVQIIQAEVGPPSAEVETKATSSYSLSSERLSLWARLMKSE